MIVGKAVGVGGGGVQAGGVQAGGGEGGEDKINQLHVWYLVLQHFYANSFSVNFTFCISSADHNHQYLNQTKCRVLAVGVGTR